jgi:hypothetical protein
MIMVKVRAIPKPFATYRATSTLSGDNFVDFSQRLAVSLHDMIATGKN